MPWSDFLSLFMALIAFVLLLVLAWWTVRLLSRGYGVRSTGSRIRIVERVMLGADKQLLIVKTAGRAFLLGVTAQHIEKLEELDADALPEPEPGKRDDAFFDLLKNALDPKKRKESGDGRGEGPRET